MDVRGRFLAAGDFELAPARRAGADEHRVEILGEQLLHAVDAVAELELDETAIEDIADLLVDRFLGQAEARDLRTDHAARALVLIEDDEFVAERRQIAHHRQRCRSASDECDPLAVLLRRQRRQEPADVVFVVGGDALQAADRHRLRLDPHAPARRLARTIARAPQNPGEHVRMPVHHVGVGVAAGRDQANVFRHRRVRRAGPLAIDDLVEIVRVADVGGWNPDSALCLAPGFRRLPIIAVQRRRAGTHSLRLLGRLPTPCGRIVFVATAVESTPSCGRPLSRERGAAAMSNSEALAPASSIPTRRRPVIQAVLSGS